MPYSEIILSTHAFIKKSELSGSVDKAKKLFHIVSKFEPDVSVDIFAETATHFGFPLHYRDFSAHTDNLIDARTLGAEASFSLKKDFELRDMQKPIIESFLQSIAKGKTGWLLNSPTGSGKCLGKGTPVLMYDGTIKAVEDVVVGDLLMGPDSKPRRVESLARGRELLYKVIPTKGEPYIVNKSHILSLRITGTRVKDSISGHRSGDIVNLSVTDYLSKNKTFVHCAKGWRTGVEFSYKATPSTLPPYFLGLWLGDGTSRTCSISNPDQEILDYLNDFVGNIGYTLVNNEKRDGFCPVYTIANKEESGTFSNVVLNALRHYELLKYKHIPHVYKTASRSDRLDLLAGIIDSDGHLSNGVYDLVFKSKVLAEDVVFVARSLGFAAYIVECVKKCTTTGASGTYFRISISGTLQCIPCRVLRKRANERKQVKDVLNTGIRVEPMEVGYYFGFTISGPDRLFLLGDFTVTHNTVMGCAMIQALKRATLIIVPRDNLIKQWVDRILSVTDLTRDDIGIAQQDVCDYKGKKIVVGMVHSLAKDKYTEEFKNYFGCVVWDEVHVVGAQTFSQTIGMFHAKYRIGMSATLSRKDGMEDVYKLAIGQVNLSPAKLTTLVSPKVFIRPFKTAKKHPYLSKMKDAKSRRGVLISELANDTARNALIAVYAKKFADSGRRIVIFSDRVEQLKFLKDVLTKRHGMSAASIGLFTGSTKDGDRKVILQHSKIILATFGVMAMGVDVPDLRAIIFGTPLSDVAQAVGRILRLCEGAKDPVVLDIVDSAYPDCVRWGHTRQKYYVDIAKATLYEVT